MRQHLVQLHQILTDRFDIEEMRTLCLYLGVKSLAPRCAALARRSAGDDHLRDEGQPGTPAPSRGSGAGEATALLEHLDNRDRIPDLVDAGKQMRPLAIPQVYQVENR